MRFRAAQAFYILTVLALVLTTAVAGIDHFRPSLLRRARVRPRIQLAMWVASVLVFSLLSWALTVSIPYESFCGASSFSSARDFDWGASPFLMVFVFCAAIASMLVVLLMLPTEEAAASAEPDFQAAYATDAPARHRYAPQIYGEMRPYYPGQLATSPTGPPYPTQTLREPAESSHAPVASPLIIVVDPPAEHAGKDDPIVVFNEDRMG
jgi:hypothetical protein